MPDPTITVVGNPDEVAERAADYVIQIVRAAIAARGRATIALAGGSTPRAMNARLAATPRRERIDWSKVAFYFGDERCVPPDHADSNYGMTRDTLFAPLAIPDAQIFRIPGEDEPQRAAQAYEERMRDTLGSPPVFDLLTLGMGPDGHTASLFPGTITTIDERRTVVANYVPKFEAYRITITPHVIDVAREVVITANGPEKAESLQAVLAGPRDFNRFPAQLVGRENRNVRWIVDAAAAAVWTATGSR